MQLSSFSSRPFTIPYKSSQAIRSAARYGGLWFQSGCSSTPSSIREGQFILTGYAELIGVLGAEIFVLVEKEEFLKLLLDFGSVKAEDSAKCLGYLR